VNLLGAVRFGGRLALMSQGVDIPPEVAALSSTESLKPEPDGSWRASDRRDRRHRLGGEEVDHELVHQVGLLLGEEVRGSRDDGQLAGHEDQRLTISTWVRLCRGRSSRPRTAGKRTTGCRGDRR
jgi:hypothetical protein